MILLADSNAERAGRMCFTGMTWGSHSSTRSIAACSDCTAPGSSPACDALFDALQLAASTLCQSWDAHCRF